MNTYSCIKNISHRSTITLGCIAITITCAIMQAFPSTSEQTTKIPDYPLLEKFIQTYAPPHEICDYLENNEEILLSTFCAIDALPGFIIKSLDELRPIDTTIYFIISRLINAERMRECIKRNNLTSLDVARKYIYTKNGQWYIIAQKIEKIKDNPEITLEEIQQIWVLAQETGYSDWSDKNWFRDSRNKLVCVDTEDRSFTLYGPLSLTSHYYVMLPEAITWLKNQSQKNICRITKPLYESSTFDDPDMNFEEVKSQLRQQYEETLKLRSKL